jgi:hypothetical protein
MRSKVNWTLKLVVGRRGVRLAHRSKSVGGSIMNRRSILIWYRILRVHYHWPLFEAIRYALWLAR